MSEGRGGQQESVLESEMLVEFLRRSFFAVDGLWFVKVEEEVDFERALELDARVWEVMAKIQARKARELLGATGNSPGELARCLALKFAAEAHDFEVAEEDNGRVEVVIRDCSWLEIMRKAGREHLAQRVAEAICRRELEVWGREFGVSRHEMTDHLCAGGEACRHVFEFGEDDQPVGRRRA